MRALVLAAGAGDRLIPHTAYLPKPLLELRGLPIINHVLDALAEAGVDQTTLVIGYRGGQLRSAVEAMHPRGMSIRFVENDRYAVGNARSLWAARDAMLSDLQADGFVLAMGDHVIEPQLVRTVADSAGERARLAIERVAQDDARADEATRALVDNGRVVDLGKSIEAWNALDTGVFWSTNAVFRAITPELRDGEAGAVFAELARAGMLDAVDVTGIRWIDIDTEEDLRAASALMGASGRVA